MEEKALIHKGDTKALTVEYTPADTTDDKTVAWSDVYKRQGYKVPETV